MQSQELTRPHSSQNLFRLFISWANRTGGRLDQRIREFSPAQSLALGYLTISLAGAVLLMLPFASETGVSQTFVDAWFTASSALSTTGLVVVDTGGYYTVFGELVILTLIQIGGLGYMAFIVLLSVLFGESVSFNQGRLFQSSIAGATRRNMKRMLWAIFLTTVFFEVVGAAAFAVLFAAEYPLGRAIYLGVFHSISTFCTAGFSLFADSFMKYRYDLWMNTVINVLSLGGAIGYFVLADIHSWSRNRSKDAKHHRLRIHSRLAIAVTLIGAVGGSVFLLIAEGGMARRDGYKQLFEATFQALSAATTTGFNSVDITLMSQGGLFSLILLMYVGASPGGTGGGIKTTTFGACVVSLWTRLRGREIETAFGRSIGFETVRQAFHLSLLAASWIAAGTLALCAAESHDFLTALFEMTSAFGTVGLSAGITSSLGVTGRLIVTVTMLGGRIGLLAVGAALIPQMTPPAYRYPEEPVYIG